MPREPDDGPLLDIRVLTSAELGAAAAVLAQGMRDNPLHVRVFGTDPRRRQRRLLVFLRQLVAYIEANGDVLGSYVQGELVGVLGMMEPGRCRPGLMDRLRIAGVVAASNRPAGMLRIGRWLSAWARNDPADPHWHIGPLAVLPAHRRRGIGRGLMLRCCRRMDALAARAYLATDLPINVAFYETLGFVVIRQESVLGVPNWFMIRPSTRSRPAGHVYPKG